MELIFDTCGNDKQKEVCRLWLEPDITEVVYGGSKISGKSFLGCSLIFGQAFTYPNTFYYIARKQLNDLRKYTIPSIHEVLKLWGITEKYYTFNGQDNYFTLYNDSRVYLLDARYMPTDPLYARFGSMQMTQGWIEEGGELTLDAKNNLVASVGRWNNTKLDDKGNELWNLPPKVLITCNPAKNFLYSEFYKKAKEKTLEPWKAFVQAYPSDNKKAPPSYLKMLEQSLSMAQKERLLFGNWEYDDDPAWLVDFDAVCDMFHNDHVRPAGKKKISADLAGRGRDRFVAGLGDGDVITIKIASKHNEPKQIEQDLKKLAADESVPRSKITADSDGLGYYLSSYFEGIKEFHGGSSAHDKMYINLKSECAFLLAKKINERQIKIICSDEHKQLIIEEMNVLKSDSVDDDTRKKALISKDEMKLLLGRSPDFLDMLIMMQYHDLIKDTKGIRRTSYK